MSEIKEKERHQNHSLSNIHNYRYASCDTFYDDGDVGHDKVIESDGNVHQDAKKQFQSIGDFIDERRRERDRVGGKVSNRKRHLMEEEKKNDLLQCMGSVIIGQFAKMTKSIHCLSVRLSASSIPLRLTLSSLLLSFPNVNLTNSYKK